MINDDAKEFTFPGKGSLYVPLPVKAIKDLANTGQRPASRVLFALCLHLGKDLQPIFPSYKTLSWYSNVGQNSIRKCLNVLLAKGYISIERKRVGRKFENHYRILKKAWHPEAEVQLTIPDPEFDISKEWICSACLEDVHKAEDVTYEKDVNWDGTPNKHWKHAKCSIYGASTVYLATPGIRARQVEQRARRKWAARQAEEERMNPVDPIEVRAPESQRVRMNAVDDWNSGW